MGGVTSESRRIEYYAKFLDDKRLTLEERAQLARHLSILIGAGEVEPAAIGSSDFSPRNRR